MSILRWAVWLWILSRLWACSCEHIFFVAKSQCRGQMHEINSLSYIFWWTSELLRLSLYSHGRSLAQFVCRRGTCVVYWLWMNPTLQQDSRCPCKRHLALCVRRRWCQHSWKLKCWNTLTNTREKKKWGHTVALARSALTFVVGSCPSRRSHWGPCEKKMWERGAQSQHWIKKKWGHTVPLASPMLKLHPVWSLQADCCIMT